MVVPAELKEVLVSWQRRALGLEALAFNKVALGVQRRVPGRGVVGKFGLGAAVVGQVTGAPGIEAFRVLGWLFGVLQGVGQRVDLGQVAVGASPAFQEGEDGLQVLAQGSRRPTQGRKPLG